MRTRILAGVAALSLAAAACGGAEAIATVNGQTITYDEVIANIQVDGDVVNQEQFTRTLLGLVADEVIVAEASAQFGIEVTEEAVDLRVDEIVASVTQSGVALADVLASSGVTETGLRAIAAQQVAQDRVTEALVADQAAPTEDQLTQRFNAVLPGRSEVCSAHILLEEEADAQAAIDRALAGEAFADLAMELSTGPSGPNGGDLGCGPPSQFVAEFANATLEAEVGVPFGPVRSSFGWHVILVSERTVPTFEELREELVATVQAETGGGLWTEWLVAALRAADVSVEPEYGEWVTEPAPTIIPPGS